MTLRRALAVAACALALQACALPFGRPAEPEPQWDVVIRGGLIVDGTGAPPRIGDVAIRGDRVVQAGGTVAGRGRTEVDARGRAVAPGFVNMLSWADEDLLVDGRGLSDLRQGVTLQVFGEGSSMGPWTEAMRAERLRRQGDLKWDAPWTSLGGYLEHLERRGVSQNVASFVGAATVRTHRLGMDEVRASPADLDAMRALVREAMEEGALGVGSSLIYAPGAYADTDELVALASEAGRCGGHYVSHMRSESDRLEQAVEELIEISRRSGAPSEIYHLKAAGRANWPKLEAVIARVEAARAEGLHIWANMYPYTAGSTGLDAAMPPWVQAGGYDAWAARLKDPAIRARVLAEMRAPTSDWENLYRQAGGAQNLILVSFRNEALKPLTGKTLAEVAALRGVSPEDAAIDLVIEDGSRVGTVYFLMSEENVRRQIALPWMSFGSDSGAKAPEGVFLRSNPHPRAYGAFARVLGRYVREEGVIPLEEAVRRMTSLPAERLGLEDRGLLAPGRYADVVVFDPEQIVDRAVYEKPHQLAEGVEWVFVNGVAALAEGRATGAPSGRAVRGRGWTGRPGGGCRASAADWTWAW